MAPDLRIEPATEDDVPLVLKLVKKLAEYERLSHEVVATEEDFRKALFSPDRVAEALLAFRGAEPVGFALYFSTFSTFVGRPGIYLEDIFVEPEHRGHGIGAALLTRIAKIACDRNCGRLEWSVLTWNEPAIGFYERLGARRMEDWRVFRLAGAALRDLAGAG
ncbi:MAG TPA: GNAT family N-acetyltransferase [Bryobacteraceae bacterium]|nr:GNAT family N-acetyltransferase [Bryobacteraceae bacterium]